MGGRASLRTDQKLSYARLTLAELDGHPSLGSNDEWENAHQEAVFYHLVGAVEGLLHEITDGYELGLAKEEVKWGKVESALSASGLVSQAFSELKRIRAKRDSWLAQLYRWRNHGTHRDRVSKIVYLSASEGARQDNVFKDPCTGDAQTIYPGLGCLDVLRALTEETDELIVRCRKVDPRL